MLSFLLVLTAQATTPATWPQPTCSSAYGTTVCGYACVEAYGTIQCADVPWGACKEAYGTITCGPSNPGFLVDARVTPQAECIEAYGKVACGYGCVEAYGTIQCAPAPGGQCTEAYGKITCTAGAYVALSPNAPHVATPGAHPHPHR